MNITGVGEDEKGSTVLAIMNAAWGWRQPGTAPYHGGMLGSTSASRSQSLQGTDDGGGRQQ